jgi:hypothetical protein
VSWWNRQPKICHYCKRSFKETTKSRDRMNRGRQATLDRVNSQKGYVEGNVVLACFRCNATKSDLFSEAEMMHIGTMIREKDAR